MYNIPLYVLTQTRRSSLYPLVSEVSREVTNLTERKNLDTPEYGVKEFVCLSVCLSVSDEV